MAPLLSRVAPINPVGPSASPIYLTCTMSRRVPGLRWQPRHGGRPQRSIRYKRPTAERPITRGGEPPFRMARLTGGTAVDGVAPTDRPDRYRSVGVRPVEPAA